MTPLQFFEDRIMIGLDTPIASVANGLPFDAAGDLIVTFTGAPLSWVNGVPLSAAGTVCASLLDVGDVVTVSNDLPFTADGRIAIDDTRPVVAWAHGVPYVPSGALAVVGAG